MCFSIPYQVTKAVRGIATLENGKNVRIGNEFKVRKGEYLRIIGDIAVGKLTKTEGINVRRMIRQYKPSLAI